MITDNCKCGSSVVINKAYSCEEDQRHDSWLKAHAVCRQKEENIKELELLKKIIKEV